MNNLTKAIRDGHMAESEHHLEMAKCHQECAAAHDAEISKASDNDSFHRSMKTQHEAAAKSHALAAVAHLKCYKSLESITDDDLQGDDQPDVNQETRLGSSQLQQAVLGDDLTQKIVPDAVRGVVPTPPPKVFAIPRHGGPEISSAGLPPEMPDFLDLKAIEN